MGNWRLLALQFALLLLMAGCNTNEESMLSRNEKAGHEIAVAAKAYTLDALAQYPTNLTDLVTERLLKSVPKCQCADGRVRDFIYIPGFTIADGDAWVFVFSPSEMHSNVALIFRMDGSSQRMTKAEAEREVAKSRNFLLERSKGASSL